MLAIIPQKIKNFCLSHTRKGKVDKLEALTNSLTQNTKLVKEKYDDLKEVEANVKLTLSELENEKFEAEIQEINKTYNQSFHPTFSAAKASPKAGEFGR